MIRIKARLDSGAGRLGVALSVVSFLSGAAHAQDIETGGKLRLTRGVSTIEGQAGGGLTPWALIAGNETDRGIGASAHATSVWVSDFSLLSYGVSAGFHDRFEISYTRQEFDTRDAGAALGLGNGFTFRQDIFGAKVRVAGNAVYDQDRWLPQIAVGANWKQNDQGPVLSAVGAGDDEDWEVYTSATKLFLDQSLLLSGTLRWTNANQGGLLGYGSASGDDRDLQLEGSAGLMLSRNIVVGGEFRSKPDNLGFATEDDWLDLFAAWAITPNFTLTGAYVDLGSIATFEDQKGGLVQLQAAF